MLTSQELADARADAAETLVDSVAIKRPTVANTNGIAEETFATASTVSGRIDPQTQRQGQMYASEREAARAYFILTVPYNADLRDGDKVTVNSVDYQVLTVHNDHSYRLMVRATVYRIDQ